MINTTGYKFIKLEPKQMTWGNDEELLFDAARIEIAPVCGYCKDCEWWDYLNPNNRTTHFCLLPCTHDDGDPDFPDSKAISRSWDDCLTWLETQPEFACNQWKAKEVEK